MASKRGSNCLSCFSLICCTRWFRWHRDSGRSAPTQTQSQGHNRDWLTRTSSLFLHHKHTSFKSEKDLNIQHLSASATTQLVGLPWHVCVCVCAHTENQYQQQTTNEPNRDTESIHVNTSVLLRESAKTDSVLQIRKREVTFNRCCTSYWHPVHAGRDSSPPRSSTG